MVPDIRPSQLKGGLVDAQSIRAAIGALRQKGTHKPILALECIDAFDMPAARYDKQRRARCEPT